MKRLQDKVAVITGGNSGIGLATAKRLREEGAQLAICGRNSAILNEAAKRIGSDVLAIRADVSKLTDIDNLFAMVSQKLGNIDILFVNAGVATFAPMENVSEED